MWTSPSAVPFSLLVAVEPERRIHGSTSYRRSEPGFGSHIHKRLVDLSSPRQHSENTITEQVSVTIDSNTLTLNSLTFKTTVVDCTASAIVITCGKGGAIKIECGDLVTAESLIVKAEFTDCECTDENDERTFEMKGWSLHVTGHELAKLIAKENWAGYPSEWNDTTEHIVWGEDNKKVGTQFETLSLLFSLIPYFGIIITTGGKGADGKGCGTQNLLSQSFATGHSHLKGVGDHKLTVKKSTILNEPEQFEGNNVVFEGDASNAEGGLCSWKSGLLNLTTTTTSIQDGTFSGWKDGGINQNG
ncbi:hypothetical protein BLNAU_10416 [Blattamonas nauphoetae]|uniref:Uncharacterized protein n=1 Tax=Blattamonas nauphoetae TaxID=2049346 RepID=A0ABQ9XT38_9EUKA|nr:hypothetical protein BLNAU_10416 [Blattamonas nauphoetae]